MTNWQVSIVHGPLIRRWRPSPTAFLHDALLLLAEAEYDRQPLTTARYRHAETRTWVPSLTNSRGRSVNSLSLSDMLMDTWTRLEEKEGGADGSDVDGQYRSSMQRWIACRSHYYLLASVSGLLAGHAGSSPDKLRRNTQSGRNCFRAICS